MRISLSQLYSSSSAMSVICQAVCHMAMTRTLFCRDLLILQKLYLHFGDNVCTHVKGPVTRPVHNGNELGVIAVDRICLCVQVFLGGGGQLLQFQQDLIPRTSHLLSSYHLLKHISQSLTSSVPMDTM